MLLDFVCFVPHGFFAPYQGGGGLQFFQRFPEANDEMDLTTILSTHGEKALASTFSFAEERAPCSPKILPALIFT